MPSGLDPRLPVLVGAGQLTVRTDRGDDALEPSALMAEALRRAEADSGGRGLLAAADSLCTISELSWRYRNPALAVAERLAVTPRQLASTVVGGNLVGVTVARAAARIQAGELDVVAVCGGEATRTRSRLRKEGREPAWTVQGDDVAAPEQIGLDRPLVSDLESRRGVRLPVQVYPLFEVALRARLGLGVDEHRRRIGRLWSAFSEVAATNPEAWIQQAFGVEEIIEPTAENRMISFPYTKRLCSNNQVDQGSGLLLCSVAAAEQAGVPRDRWVFLHAGTEAVDHWNVSNRADLCSSPALRLAGRDAFALAGIVVDDVAHVDLYSCFPAAVQIGAIELGLVPDPRADGTGWGAIGATRPLTVTGGMTFAGGPLNDYTSHGIATMVGVLRADPGAIGLCTANGGYTTEHAVVILSTEPPTAGAYRHSEPQAEVDALPRVELDDEWAGAVTVESVTVPHERSGPTHVLAAARTPDGRRTWCSSSDPALMAAAMGEELVGRAGTRRPDTTLELD
jgi:acetyl-CoA C-acetyltransferase